MVRISGTNYIGVDYHLLFSTTPYHHDYMDTDLSIENERTLILNTHFKK